MAARLALSRVAPALFRTRVAPSLAACKAARTRGYATPSENSVRAL